MTIQNFKLFTSGVNESSLHNVKAYHASNSDTIREFRIENSGGANLYGNAMYFSNSYHNIWEFGKKVYVVELTMRNTLDANKYMTVEQANQLKDKFSSFVKEPISYKFKKSEYSKVQFNDFLEELQAWGDYYNTIGSFIQSLGYDSFKHYADGHTNFIQSKPKGKYDQVFITYGVYNSNQVKIVERQFNTDHLDSEDDFEYDEDQEEDGWDD